ncbi:YhbY family RNA-binding protein [Eubacteriales bacterium OttesenSCG-928-M02]|nr:YhbY family RNA-binding protein [Eubacteriales bacterium OttesenSCG-928-M02]
MITTKQRAHLRALSNNLDPILHIGKGGITQNTIVQAEEALTARELIKGTCLETSPVSAQEAMAILAGETDAEGVAAIGRRFILYRRNPENPRISL